ncbi:putative immunity protein [Sporolactobacillus terrae]|uniref:Imm-5-like domain-containing protein n=1 Tax=Sporolactobacillus terrae TaxID=269673 RepID=A0ABX5Q472_9BACL|nr:hypothetical protein [Sporolactobacillus terrae]QAA21439.1 hypothetical protein C0674_01685 [Sporolactobacillus terrae]QAA24411.1 hypothetical protein C0679_01665 [Sporolactobacillus terrae]UAK16237.1 hypothetical protein K7399_14945 [Sporolactobacillus terrae]
MQFIESERKKAIDEKLQTVSQKIAALWAVQCAEHVICYFDQERPKDNRPRKAVDAARAWARGRISIADARKTAFAAHAAARAAKSDAAIAAARSAGQAAATAHMTGHAIHASTYAAKSVFHATDGDLKAVDQERMWQYDRLCELALFIKDD